MVVVDLFMVRIVARKRARNDKGKQGDERAACGIQRTLKAARKPEHWQEEHPETDNGDNPQAPQVIRHEASIREGSRSAKSG